jgi:rod shape-determining protein MreD
VHSIALTSSRSRTPRQRFATHAEPQWHVVVSIGLIALIAQSTVVHYAAVHGVMPSLVLVVVVWYSIRVDVRRAALYGLLAGICEDVLAGTTGAAWTISTALTAVFTSLLTRDFFADSVPLAAAVTAVATVMRALFFWTIMSLEGYPAGLAGIHLHQAFWQAAFNVVVMIVAVLVLRRVEPEAA